MFRNLFSFIWDMRHWISWILRSLQFCMSEPKIDAELFCLHFDQFNTQSSHMPCNAWSKPILKPFKSNPPCDNWIRTGELHLQLPILFPLIIPVHVLPQNANIFCVLFLNIYLTDYFNVSLPQRKKDKFVIYYLNMIVMIKIYDQIWLPGGTLLFVILWLI